MSKAKPMRYEDCHVIFCTECGHYTFVKEKSLAKAKIEFSKFVDKAFGDVQACFGCREENTLRLTGYEEFKKIHGAFNIIN